MTNFTKTYTMAAVVAACCVAISCSEDTGGSGGASGSGGAGGSGGGSAGDDSGAAGSSAGESGSGGTPSDGSLHDMSTAGEGGGAGTTDAASEDAAVYVDPQCAAVCPAWVAPACPMGPATVEACNAGCTVEMTTGACAAELGAALTCAAGKTFTCANGDPVTVGCDPEFNAVVACSSVDGGSDAGPG